MKSDQEEQKKRPRVKMEFTAGGVVYKRSRQGPMIGFILDPYNKWTFAKGHIEPGETPERAALRETREEMGIQKLMVIKPLGKIDIWFYERHRAGKLIKGKHNLIHKFIYYFLMKVPRMVKTRPQRKEFIKAIRWVRVDDAGKGLSYKNVKPILEAAIQEIKKCELEIKSRRDNRSIRRPIL